MECPDRSAYNLIQDTKATCVRMTTDKKLAELKTIEIFKQFRTKIIGKLFNSNAKEIRLYFAALALNELEELENNLDAGRSNTGCKLSIIIIINRRRVKSQYVLITFIKYLIYIFLVFTTLC